MPKLDNVAVARTFHEAWAQRDPDRGVAVIADDCEFIDVPRGELQYGPRAIGRITRDGARRFQMER